MAWIDEKLNRIQRCLERDFGLSEKDAAFWIANAISSRDGKETEPGKITKDNLELSND